MRDVHGGEHVVTAEAVGELFAACGTEEVARNEKGFEAVVVAEGRHHMRAGLVIDRIVGEIE